MSPDSTHLGDATQPGDPGDPAASTHRLIAELASDLSPVRRLPRLRVAVLGALGALGVALAAVLVSTGARADLGALMAGDSSFAAVLGGLVVCGLGALLAALASGTPGREREVQAGAGLAALGLVGAVALCLPALLAKGGLAGSFAADGHCLAMAILLAALPGAAVLFAAFRGWVGRPGAAAAAALAVGGAFGALAVHLACPLPGVRHFLMGHGSTPVVLMALASIPLALLLRRYAH